MACIDVLMAVSYIHLLPILGPSSCPSTSTSTPDVLVEDEPEETGGVDMDYANIFSNLNCILNSIMATI